MGEKERLEADACIYKHVCKVYFYESLLYAKFNTLHARQLKYFNRENAHERIGSDNTYVWLQVLKNRLYLYVCMIFIRKFRRQKTIRHISCKRVEQVRE